MAGFTPYSSPPSGAAGGALTGTYPNPGIAPASVLSAQPWLWQPGDNNFLMASADPLSCAVTIALTAGTLYLVKLIPRANLTLTNIGIALTVIGAGASTGSFVGAYNSAGTLLSGSADMATQFSTATGFITCPLTTPQALTGGTFIWAAILSNLATTQPTLAKSGAGVVVSNAGLTAANFRFAVNGTGLTSLPANITPSANTNTGSQDLFIAGT